MSGHPSTFISPHAIVDSTAKIGLGTKIWHFANIMRQVVIGRDCMIASYTQLDPYTTVGDRTRVQQHCAITGHFGRDIFIGPHATFVDAPYPPGRQLPPRVRDNAIIGTGAIIFPVEIGEGAIVASGSIVTRDVPPNIVVMGAPAKEAGTRKDYELKRVRWNQNAMLSYGYD